MQNQDQIEEFFQRHERKLNERPSADVWDRLERRLDQRKAKPNFVWTKMLAAASITLALAASGTVFYALGKRHEQTAVVAQKEQRQGPLAENQTTALPPATQNNTQQPPLGPSEQRNPPQNIDEANERPTEGAAFPPVDYPTFESRQGDMARPTVDNDVFIAPGGPASKDVAAPPVVTAPKIYADRSAESEMAAPQIGDFSEDDNDMAPATPSRAEAKPKVRANANKEAAAKPSPAGLSPALGKFKWLVGTWRDNRYEGTSMEVWEIKNPNALEGRGVLILNGDTLLSERITLLEENGEVYYIAPLDPVNRRTKFKLAKSSPTRFVFEQLDPESPSEVILEINKDGSFSTEIRHKGKSGQYNIDETNYLSKRNYLNKQEAKRVLSR